MPYELDGDCVKKKDTGETVKCHDSHEEAVAHMRALEANVHDSLVEMSMRVTKAAYQKSDKNPMRWAAIDSDTEEDLYKEKMAPELYQDFIARMRDNTPIPEEFKDIVCEADWCGGMPYLSIAHFKSGSEKRNVPGEVENVYIDGNRLKSKGFLYNNDMGRAVFDSLCEDLYQEKSNPDHLPVRVSIGFLDLEHKHRTQDTSPEVTFKRERYGQICPLCAQGIGGKIYTKGHLIHLALTRVPVNPRTQMSVERSMDEITTKRDDAKSIIGELADGLEEKSISSDVLVVRSEDGAMPKEEDWFGFNACYDPNTDSFDQSCIDSIMSKYAGKPEGNVTVKSFYDAVQASMAKYFPVLEEKMEDVTKKSQVEPAPVEIEKAMKAEEEKEEEDEKGDEKKEKSALDAQFEALKSALTGKKSASEIQAVFNALGEEVEKSYTPPAPSADDIASIVRSAVEAAVRPVMVEVATLKAQIGKGVVTQDNGTVTSRALNLNGQEFLKPEDLIQRSVPQQPSRKLTQIEQLAYKSTGALR